jgi:hypothetical protein
MYPTENRLRRSRSPELAFCGPFGNSLVSELPLLHIGSALNKCFMGALYAMAHSLAIRCNPHRAFIGAIVRAIPTDSQSLRRAPGKPCNLCWGFFIVGAIGFERIPMEPRPRSSAVSFAPRSPLAVEPRTRLRCKRSHPRRRPIGQSSSSPPARGCRR